MVTFKSRRFCVFESGEVEDLLQDQAAQDIMTTSYQDAGNYHLRSSLVAQTRGFVLRGFKQGPLGKNIEFLQDSVLLSGVAVTPVHARFDPPACLAFSSVVLVRQYPPLLATAGSIHKNQSRIYCDFSYKFGRFRRMWLSRPRIDERNTKRTRNIPNIEI